MRSILKGAGSVLFVALVASVGLAQQRTFVSGAGVDNPSCNLASPCRTFSQAISANSAGGEVVALDSAQYDPFSISKAISIIAPLGAGISVPSLGNGITISAGSGDEVVLRGLTINAEGNGHFGIVANSVGGLHIENCVINGFNGLAGVGVEFKTPGGKLFVKDTAARRNYIGIDINPSGGFVLASMEGLSLNNNYLGLSFYGGAGGVQGAIRNSSVSGNANYGIEVDGTLDGTAGLDVENCLIANNWGGLLAQNAAGGKGGGMSISNCLISHNGAVWNIVAPGFIDSRGNNTVIGNGPAPPGSGNLGPLPPQ